jgi:hypothetical protein
MDINKSFKHISKKSLLGALLFAIALWLYAALSSNYSTLVNMPLVIKLPTDRAFEEAPPQYVTVESKGTGWNLFNLIFFNNSKKVFLDLSQIDINDSVYSISRPNLLKGVQSMERVELSDVLTENLVIHTGKVSSYSVKVEPNFTINPSDGFTIVGSPNISPEFVEINGNDKIVKNINTWKTKKAVFDEVNKSFTENIELSDSLKGIIKIDKKYVKFTTNIQQTAEVTFDEIRVKIRGGVMPKNYSLYPNFITLTFRGGINEIIDVTPDKINVTINYADIVNDKTGIIIPKIEHPANLKIIKMVPQYLINYKIIKSNSLADIR